MSSSSAVSSSTQTRRNALRVVTCCALCMTLMLNLPTQNVSSMNADSLRGQRKRKNFAKETLVASNLTASSLQQHLHKNDTAITRSSTNITLDYIVAGFAKCGTSTLLKTFQAHNETAVAPKEECSLDLMEDDNVAFANVAKALTNASLSSQSTVKRGIKCPFSFTNKKSLPRLQKWFPDTKLIFGLRHPVKYFESYYNYRVMAFHAGKIKGPIPPAETLLHSNEWARVSTESARFEARLQQLVVKASNNNQDTKSTLKFPVFLYTLEQMKEERENEALRQALGSFLQLKYPIQPLPLVNVNKYVGDDGYKETIDICDSKYNKLRSILVANGKKTQQWIRDELMPQATVANRDGFVEHLKQWSIDPCDSTSAQEQETEEQK